MNVCLLGGSGFIGTRLARELEDEVKLSIIDKQQSVAYPNITKIADVRDKQALRASLRGQEVVILLAAEHKDNVSPISLYYDVNVEGARNVTEVAEELGIKRILFTSSVAVYGFHDGETDEKHVTTPVNHYGKSKLQAEEILRAWFARGNGDRNLVIVRPVVVFGEHNRGNVYNLLRQLAAKRFVMVGSGENRKSMAYVGNVAAFIRFLLRARAQGYHLFNYADKPDLSMNELVALVRLQLGGQKNTLRMPYTVGILGGTIFDVAAKVTGRQFPVSAVRVKKFCLSTVFSAAQVQSSGFIAPFSLLEGLQRTIGSEFLGAHSRAADAPSQKQTVNA